MRSVFGRIEGIVRIEEVITVEATPDIVWALFQDVPSISRCLPGAQLGEQLAPDRYAGRMTVKLGPISAGFDGEATVVADAQARSAQIDGRGIDKRGGSRGHVVVHYSIREASGGGSTVMVEADLTLSGPAAQFGRVGLIQELSRRLIQEFVTCLEAKLGAADADQAAEVGAGEVRPASLLIGGIGATIRKGLRRD